MEKEFITYEQALALKQLGFNEHCFGYYLKVNGDRKIQLVKQDLEFQGHTYVLAPLYQQAFRWFREKYGLDSFINSEWIQTVKVGYYFNADSYYSQQPSKLTYKEAELECLKKLIEIVKEKK